MNESGVYRSDVGGHLLILALNPVRVTCVICLEICDRSQFKTGKDFKVASSAFVEKHGALDVKIANNIGEIVEDYLSRKFMTVADR